MEIKAYIPKSTILSDLIDCFYILKKKDTEADIKYVTFPSIFSIVSITQGASLKFIKDTIIVTEHKSEKIKSYIVSKFKNPICFEYKGTVEEITIYFKPLTLYSFLNTDLNTYADGTPFFPYADFEKVLSDILLAKKDEDKINKLETYLLSKYTGAKHPFLPELIAELQDIKNIEIPIATLVKKYNLSAKNLIKHFERHICKTPSQFRKIVRFREAMKKYIQSPEEISLTELSYILNYFDQSHLIREFKAITGFTPKYFFKNLTPLQEGKINWVFI
jgi:AraC-like DNA-binding protein